MNLQQLEYFKNIAETGSFTESSKQLSITQPALSKAITKLENELNISLFKKNGRKIEITSFGKVFLSYVDKALIEIDKGIKELKEMKNDNESTIVISTTPRVGAHFMNFIISDFFNNNRNIKFQFNQQFVYDIIKDLRSGDINIGFFDSKDDILSYSDIEFLPIISQEYILIVPKEHKLSNKKEVSLKELSDESFIAFCENSRDKLSLYKDILGYTPKISIQSKGSNIISSSVEGLVAAGAGISIVPNTPMINTNVVSILKIREKLKHRVIYMGYSNESCKTDNSKKFKDFIKESIKCK